MDTDADIKFGGYYFSIEDLDVQSADGTSAGLRPQSVKVFNYLAQHRDRVVTRQEVEDNVWGDAVVTDESLTKCISEIRKALGDHNRTILKTFPKRGYQLVADTNFTSNAVAVGVNVPVATTTVPIDVSQPSPKWLTSKIKRRSSLFILLIVVLGLFQLIQRQSQSPEQDVTGLITKYREDGIPGLAIKLTGDKSQISVVKNSLIPELRVALSRYRTVELVTNTEPDIELHIRQNEQTESIIAELVAKDSEKILFAESYSRDEHSDDNSSSSLAIRIAAAVASPGVGAVDSYLLESSKLIPPEEMSKAACYAHGYGCSKCSGEEDNVTRRAEACLAALIERDPDDARAWALQATIHAHQYWWANTLPEPIRSDPSLRTHLPGKAIEAANRAEALSDGRDTAVYWGMAEAYYAACESDKLKTAIDRGLEINPSDPNLLGAFGNWLAYSGKWEQGVELTMKALEIEQSRYRQWWWMGPAKAAYFHENFEQAYQYFLKSFNERNWMSHLQLAYTLPHLGRVDEARKSVATLQYMYPGFTREKALEIYDLLCFPDSFLRNIDNALRAAGLPSRGSSDDLTNITLPRARVISLGGVAVEYLDVGKGDPVVFVHGAFNDYRSWGHYMVPLSENHRYISYSRRYFGTQNWQDEGENYSIDVFSDDLIQLIESLELGRVHLVSWSSGVRTALAATVKRPDLIKSAIHFEPVENNVMLGSPDFETIEKLQSDWRAGYKAVVEQLQRRDEEGALQEMVEHVFEMDDGGYAKEREPLREVFRQNARTLPVTFSRRDEKIKLTCDYVSQVKIPTLIVYGEKTHEYWKLMAARFAECLPNSTLASVKGSNHYTPIEKIDEFSQLIIGFADEHR